MFSLTELIKQRLGENLALHQHINPQFAKVLKTIGFDKVYGRSSGVSLFDDKDNEYFDFLAGYGVYAIGRNHPKIKAILKEAIDLDFTNLVQMEAPLLSGLLAEKLISIFGHGVRDQVYFTNSGTEAIESTIKFSRCATGRHKLLFLDHAFHGLTTGSLALNGNKEFRNGFGELLSGDAVPMNDLQALETCLKTRDYAGFFFEPIQGKGVFIPDAGYLKAAIQLCRDYGTLSIADEVQSGMGRTGRWLACEHFEAEPDMIALSKALSGGMVPVGAVVYKHEIYEKVFSRMDRCVVHSSTFGQNNLAMVCGLASLAIIEEEGLLANTVIMGDKLLTGIEKLREKHDWIHAVRGKGLMLGIEFGKPSGFKKKLAWDIVHKLDKGLFGELIVMPLLSKHRILTQVTGHHQDIIKLIPPLTLEDRHVTAFLEALDDVLTDCDKVTGPIFTMGKNLAKHAMQNR